MSINRVILTGYLARAIEIKEIRPGLIMGKITVATVHKYKNKDGELVKETCFMECTLWNDLARRYEGLKKGDLVTVDGRLKQDTWRDRETGQERFKYVVIVDNLVFDVSGVALAKTDERVEVAQAVPQVHDKPTDIWADTSFPF